MVAMAALLSRRPHGFVQFLRGWSRRTEGAEHPALRPTIQQLRAALRSAIRDGQAAFQARIQLCRTAAKGRSGACRAQPLGRGAVYSQRLRIDYDAIKLRRR